MDVAIASWMAPYQARSKDAGAAGQTWAMAWVTLTLVASIYPGDGIDDPRNR